MFSLPQFNRTALNVFNDVHLILRKLHQTALLSLRISLETTPAVFLSQTELHCTSLSTTHGVLSQEHERQPELLLQMHLT